MVATNQDTEQHDLEEEKSGDLFNPKISLSFFIIFLFTLQRKTYLFLKKNVKILMQEWRSQACEQMHSQAS